MNIEKSSDLSDKTFIIPSKHPPPHQTTEHTEEHDYREFTIFPAFLTSLWNIQLSSLQYFNIKQYLTHILNRLYLNS